VAARGVGINGLTVDNGQHILLGAYQQSLKLMKTVGVDLNAAFLRLPLQMIYPEHEDGMHFIAPRLPAPLHMLVALWRATGLRREDKLALARFSSAARWMGWTLNTDCTVTELLQRFDQTDRLCRLMWNPLCIAALNTPAEQASAQVFLNVLRDSLGASRAASDMLLPRLNLSALFPKKRRNSYSSTALMWHVQAQSKQSKKTAHLNGSSSPSSKMSRHLTASLLPLMPVMHSDC
jgi:hypothetical protein